MWLTAIHTQSDSHLNKAIARAPELWAWTSRVVPFFSTYAHSLVFLDCSSRSTEHISRTNWKCCCCCYLCKRAVWCDCIYPSHCCRAGARGLGCWYLCCSFRFSFFFAFGSWSFRRTRSVRIGGWVKRWKNEWMWRTFSGHRTNKCGWGVHNVTLIKSNGCKLFSQYANLCVWKCNDAMLSNQKQWFVSV